VEPETAERHMGCRNGVNPLASALDIDLRRLREGSDPRGSRSLQRAHKTPSTRCRKATRGAGNRPSMVAE
jgi:hypothetical protein